MEIYKCERYIYDAENGDYVYDETTGEPVTVPNDNFDAMEIDGEAVELDCNPSLELDRDYTVRLKIGSDKVIKDFSLGNWDDDPNQVLRSVIIPEGVTSIGICAFCKCGTLSSITIPDSVTSIGNDAFQECYDLSSITIPDSVTSIGNNAFQGCDNLSSVTIGLGVTSIGGSAFSECENLSSVTIGSGVTSIGGFAFGNCTRLSSVTIGSGVTSIGVGIFANCGSLTDITYNGTVDQWLQIDGGVNVADWSAKTIHCTDGDYRYSGPEPLT